MIKKNKRRSSARQNMSTVENREEKKEEKKEENKVELKENVQEEHIC